jgi:hypothetical protein
MKCDTDPIACQPCRQKSLRCFTTDRVTGHARERGQTDRVEGEIAYLREQLHAYQTHYGRVPSEGAPSRRSSHQTDHHLPSPRYVGWLAPDHVQPLCRGPVNGTMIDTMGRIIDVCDFVCDPMDEPPPGQQVFNASRTSIVHTIFGFQRIDTPQLPTKQEAMSMVDGFLMIMTQYYPVVHRPSFKALAERYFDQPNALSLAEQLQVVLVLATMLQQMGLRNHSMSADSFDKSHNLLHYALGHYREIYLDTSLRAMQALSLMVLYLRNLPKPGATWSFSHQVLVRTIELQYHRDPEKIILPPDERSVLDKELRKRVFHALLGVCVTTGCRVGLPAPWQFQHMDIPLPLEIRDMELTGADTSAKSSGKCDFRPAIHLSKQVPLLTELYNHVLSIRQPAAEYAKTVEALNTKIVAWRQDWDESMKTEQPLPVTLKVATLLIDQWFAEYQLTLHHPACCTSDDPHLIDRHQEICHRAAKRLLSAFHTLSKEYKGVDFTWHSIGPYAMAFGFTLYYYERRLGPGPREQFESMCNEFKGWMSLMAYADVVMRTGNYLQHVFRPRAQTLEDEYRKVVIDAPRPAPHHANFQAVNGNMSRPQIKTEPSPLQSSSRVSTGPSPTVAGRRSSVSIGVPPFDISENHSPAVNPWSGHSNATHYAETSAVTTNYASYPQNPPQAMAMGHQSAAPSQPYGQQIPVSLAPLLNGTSEGYKSYGHASSVITQTAGPATMDNSLMTFSPLHYYEGVAWPLITMPPGQQ